MKYKFKLKSGFHIPFEYCDKCLVRCDRYGKVGAEAEEINKRREEIAKYLKQMGFQVHTYASPLDMSKILNFEICMFNNKIESLETLILFIELNQNREIMLTLLYGQDEDRWYEELKKEGKISAIMNLMK